MRPPWESPFMPAAWPDIERCLPQLWRTVRGYEANPALQEELMQEILLALWRSLGTLRQDERFLPFALRVAHNLCASHVREAVRAPLRLQLDEAAAELGAAPAPPDELRWLLAAVRRLPLPLRQVQLLQLEGFDYREIAELLGISVDNVGVRAHRARKQLQEMLDGC